VSVEHGRCYHVTKASELNCNGPKHNQKCKSKCPKPEHGWSLWSKHDESAFVNHYGIRHKPLQFLIIYLSNYHTDQCFISHLTMCLQIHLLFFHLLHMCVWCGNDNERKWKSMFCMICTTRFRNDIWRMKRKFCEGKKRGKKVKLELVGVEENSQNEKVEDNDF